MRSFFVLVLVMMASVCNAQFPEPEELVKVEIPTTTIDTTVIPADSLFEIKVSNTSISTTLDNKVYVFANTAELRTFMLANKAVIVKKQITIQADISTDYKQIQGILDVIKEIEVYKISLITNKEPAKD